MAYLTPDQFIDRVLVSAEKSANGFSLEECREIVNAKGGAHYGPIAVMEQSLKAACKRRIESSE